MGKKQLQEYFNGVIDWKFFNALRDRLLKYEDKGIECEISINIMIGTSVYLLFIYDADRLAYSNNINDNTIKSYEQNGLFYCIYIPNNKSSKEFATLFNPHKYDYEISRVGERHIVYKKK